MNDLFDDERGSWASQTQDLLDAGSSFLNGLQSRAVDDVDDESGAEEEEPASKVRRKFFARRSAVRWVNR